MPIQYVHSWRDDTDDQFASRKHEVPKKGQALESYAVSGEEDARYITPNLLQQSDHGGQTERMDRREIIRRIKEKGAARQHVLGGLAAAYNTHESASQESQNRSPQALLPAPHFGSEGLSGGNEEDSWSAAGLTISRPTSALHKGDFHGHGSLSPKAVNQDSKPSQRQYVAQDLVASSPPAPWHNGYIGTRKRLDATPIASSNHDFRPRAASIASVSKSFTYQPPTSPLVHQASAEDSPDDYAGLESSQDTFGRRRTFSPAALNTFGSLNDRSPASFTSSPPSLRQGSSTPYQAHQPRRSISGEHNLPPSPQAYGRRVSLISSSPSQQPMVGSFEESILRGRMSSTPSKPLDFTANIGVLGMGDCKPALKCPPHVTIPFPAVFYNYGHERAHDRTQPSPYVGMVDLENSSATHELQNGKRKRTRRHREVVETPSDAVPPHNDKDSEQDYSRLSRRPRPILDDPRGGYRIPAKGQLQIIIKNPNKTAVKLFLVPYDVTDIRPGQKTFLRQRSYSSGPIIDMPLDQRKNLGSYRPEAALSYSTDPSERPVLRYLIHLHICCPRKDRIFLHKSIRVVFANRVPDGKEKLRNEIQFPEPKYSTYRPEVASAAPTPTLKAPRSWTSGNMDLDELISPISRQPSTFLDFQRSEIPRQSIPMADPFGANMSGNRQASQFRFSVLETATSRLNGRADGRGQVNDSAGRNIDFHSQSASQTDPVARVRSPISPLMSPGSAAQRPISPVTTASEGSGSFTFSRSSSSDGLQNNISESLLSKRLRDLEVNRGPAK